MLINSKDLLLKAKENKYAIPQFNINGLEWAKYILEEAQQLNQPVILGFSENQIKYMGGYKTVVNIVKGLIEDLNLTIDIVLHLDHGKSVEACKKAIDNGFTSVMYDGSSLSIDDNANNTNEIINYAKIENVSVEGEVGTLGTKNDDVIYTDIISIEKFNNLVSVDSIAPAVGNVHGLYKGEPKIDVNLIKEISKLTNKPLVLHGGSGLSDETFIECINNGICKININTDFQIAWANSVKKYLNENKEEYSPRKIISSGEEAIKETARKYFLLFSNK